MNVLYIFIHNHPFAYLMVISSWTKGVAIIGVGVGVGVTDVFNDCVDKLIDCDKFRDCIEELLLLGSLALPFLGPRFFGGGAFDTQPWQYHFPRGTYKIFNFNINNVHR